MRYRSGDPTKTDVCSSCAEGAEAFEALPTAVRGMGPWTGGPEGAIDRLGLPFRVMLNQQGFAVI